MKKIRRTALASAAITAAVIPVAWAAPPQPPPSYIGWYFGVNGGASFGRSNTMATFLDDPLVSQTILSNGPFGGFEGGYNARLSPNLIVGVVADFDWMSQSGEETCNTDTEGCSNSRLGWVATQRGLIGFTSNGMPGLVWFVTGGAAEGHVETWVMPSVVDGEGCSVSNTQVGWAAGGGVMGQFTESLFWKAKYLHVDLGTARGTVGYISYSNRATEDQIRFSLDYHFW